MHEKKNQPNTCLLGGDNEALYPQQRRSTRDLANWFSQSVHRTAKPFYNVTKGHAPPPRTLHYVPLVRDRPSHTSAYDSSVADSLKQTEARLDIQPPAHLGSPQPLRHDPKKQTDLSAATLAETDIRVRFAKGPTPHTPPWSLIR
ncbi:MAG: hypothetical protein JJE47_17750 [Acidimicrobiia bacterium]|nr:hypothetical protein [Acidimicrobiia bacterium]